MYIGVMDSGIIVAATAASFRLCLLVEVEYSSPSPSLKYPTLGTPSAASSAER